ncbi:hypothetical protein CF319_g2898 [Tilletia indica]|uniref:Uncharacterized protein n=1 Tax=Tilletia indica TaxID=43049 RepID=A0A177T6T6_9BASI|nr:hypothetical protein CF319_g2898 [Tilletia indica]KAE8230630.1 hypothetical protein CF326_g4364 [Tilletia indica]KAE8241540.1 hypothetical protein A4X13_0g7368 [Tilletia indica]
MSINWVLTNSEGTRPQPLPAEDVLYRSQVCQLQVEFKNAQPPAKWEAEGIIFVTCQRLIFLRSPPLPPPADPTQPSPHLRNLAIPLLGNLISVRYLMPIFSAPHLELKVHPVRNGGLPQDAIVSSRSDGADTARTAAEMERLAGVVKVTFREGGGTILKDAIDRALRNPVPLAGGRQAASEPDPLPLYQAPSTQNSDPSEVAAAEAEPPVTEERTDEPAEPPRLATQEVEEPPPYAV